MFFFINSKQKRAGEILSNLKEHPDAWTRVDTILEFSQNQQTKYFALQILEKTIKTKWKILPKNQTEGMVTNNFLLFNFCPLVILDSFLFFTF